MTVLDNPYSYGSVSKVLHWAMAVLLIVIYFLGLEAAEDHDPTIIEIHNSLGVILMLLALFRFVWRYTSPKTKIYFPYPYMEVTFEIVVTIFYLVMIVMPITGYIFFNLEGETVSFFGITLPNFVAPDASYEKWGHAVHQILSGALIYAFILHIVGSLYHHFYLKDDSLRRMLPGYYEEE